ncbi:MAG: helix-turn-helix domain-containing protein [Bacteroidota bacterium]
MENFIMSSIPINELITVISETVKIEFERQNNLSTPIPDNEYISRKETARILGVSLPTLNDWSKRQLIPSYRIASRIRYKKDEVLNSLNKRKFRREAA